jgi:hypothetical protein
VVFKTINFTKCLLRVIFLEFKHRSIETRNKLKKMNRKFTIICLSLFLMLCPLFLSNIFGDQPPDPGGGPGGGDPVGGGSPIGSGLIFMLGMALVYGIKKVYKAKYICFFHS